MLCLGRNVHIPEGVDSDEHLIVGEQLAGDQVWVAGVGARIIETV